MTDKPDLPEDSDSDTSLSGKGWDILAGGKDAPFMGDETTEQTLNEFLDSPSPFADDREADRVIEEAGQGGTPSVGVSLPPESFWDRGRGGDAGGTEPIAAGVEEAPPRDLSPEELGALFALPESSPLNAEPLTPVPSVGDMSPASSSVIPLPTENFDMESYPSHDLPIEQPVTEEPASSPESPVEEVPAPTLESLEAQTASLLEMAVADAFGTSTTPLAPAESTSIPQPTQPVPPIPPWQLPSEPSVEIAPQQVPGLLGTVDDPFAARDTDWKLSSNPNDPDLPANPEVTRLLVTKERMDALWREIDQTYNIVINDVRGYYETTEYALAELKQAREFLMAGYEYYENAEQLVMGVKAKLRLEEKVRQWSSTRGTWIGIYLITWFSLLSLSSVALYLYRIPDLVRGAGVPDVLVGTILPSLFGAFGGVVGALWVLIKHTSKERDFDPIHTQWYIMNPLLGGALGVITYLVVYVSSLFLTNTVVQGEVDVTSTRASILYIVLCTIVGFRQNVLWELIERLLKAILPKKAEDETETPIPTPTSDGAG